jgi:hypothetical protein
VEEGELMHKWCDIECDHLPQYTWITLRTDTPILIKFNTGEFYKTVDSNFNFHLGLINLITTLHNSTHCLSYCKIPVRKVAWTYVFTILQKHSPQYELSNWIWSLLLKMMTCEVQLNFCPLLGNFLLFPPWL